MVDNYVCTNMLFSKSKDTIMIVFMFIGKLFYSYI